ncbi:hypothetical protein RB200_31925 [Streptomyces sp. PmtG]
MADWEERGVALLPLGRRFDVIRVPAERIHAALGSDEDVTVASGLRAWLEGPVIRDLRSPRGPYYVLIAPDADWDGPPERLTTGAYLGVPRPGHSTVPTRWVVLTPHPGTLCDTRHVRTLLSPHTPHRTVDR